MRDDCAPRYSGPVIAIHGSLEMNDRSPSPVLSFSHLRWDFVYQRPQHVLSRIAETRPVHFVEEPVPSDGKPSHWRHSTPHPNVTVWKPALKDGGLHGFSEEVLPELRGMIQQLVHDQDLQQCLLWFYTPMATTLADGIAAQAVVYDCMDELSAFLNAPRVILARESALLHRADVVFTGGPSLYLAKKNRHHNVHCFPSSVDATHFGKAKGKLQEPRDQREISSPRLGFFGVIDERLDIQLLDELAIAHPEWQIIMVGPVVKIDPATLPRHENIHYLGQRSYAELPAYISGWDLCLLPFARNQATKFISPTKTLEYMAAEKMIVSTPITDVAEPYANIVFLGDGPSEFIEQCERALDLRAADRNKRIKLMRDVLAKTSWDNTVQQMLARIDSVEPKRVTPTPQPDRDMPRIIEAPVERHPVIIIGAGPTGLSAAYHLIEGGVDPLILDKNDRIGGWCRSVEDNGFTFDMAGHIMFSKDPYVHELYEKLLGDNVHWQEREAFVYSKGVYTRYPFQGCLYGLPADVITECIVGAIEARFGQLKKNDEMEDTVSKAAAKHASAPNGNGHAKISRSPQNSRLNGSCSGDVKDCCGDGIIESESPLRRNGRHPANGDATRHPAASNGNGHVDPGKPRNFEEFIYKVWGQGIAKHFAIPYNEKLWAVPLNEMETSWLGGRVPMPDIEEMIRYALTPAAKPMGPNARFGYPLRGGFQALMNGFLPHIQDQLLLNSSIAAVFPSRHVIKLNDGREFAYDQLISSMPLPLLIRAMGNEAPRAVRRAASGLRHVSVRCVNIGIGREKINNMHWIYFPEDTVFHRIFVQGNASPHCNPPGGFGITCEITYSPTKPLPCDGEELIQRCIDDCKRIGFFREDDPIWAANQVDMPMAYVVYDHDRAENVEVIRKWLLQRDIILAGRYSEWEYFNSDHAFISGKNAAELVKSTLQKRPITQDASLEEEGSLAAR
jgi:UDP-galactopyranose mutase